VPDSVEGFLHVKKDGSGVYIVVKVLAKLVSKFGQF